MFLRYPGRMTRGFIVALSVTIILSLSAFIHTVSSQVLLRYPDFSNITDWYLNGQTQLDVHRTGEDSSNILRLTPDWYNMYGSAWLKRRLDITHGFTVSFKFLIQNPSGNAQILPSGKLDTGGDGIAFVIQNQDTDALGYNGGNIGYGGIIQSVAVEFDTWSNDVENNDNHVAIHSSGAWPNNPLWSGGRIGYNGNLPVTLDDGFIHVATIRYTPPRIQIYLDHCEMPIIDTALYIPRYVSSRDGKAWFGFTAATGSAFESHDILDFSWSAPRIGDTIYAVPDTICYGDSLVLSCPLDGPWKWNTGDTTKQITVIFPGIYRVKGIDPSSLPCEEASSTWFETVVVLSQEKIVPVDSTILWVCPGDSATIRIVPQPGTQYRWNDGISNTVRTVSSGSYTISGITKTGCSTDTVTFHVYEYLPGKITIHAFFDSICKGRTTKAWVERQHVNTFSWNVGGLNGDTVEISSGKYWAFGYGEGGCKVWSDTITIYEYPVPSISLPEPPISCIGDTIHIVPDVSKNSTRITSWAWNDGSSDSVLATTVPGSYYVTITDVNGCQRTSNAVLAAFYKADTLNIIPMTDTVVCQGEIIILTTTWTHGPVEWSDGQTGDSVYIRASKTDTIISYGTGGNPCDIVTDTIVIHSLPTKPLRIICADSVLAVNQEGRMDWYLISGGSSTLVGKGNSLLPRETGKYYARLTDTVGCLSNSDTVDWSVSYVKVIGSHNNIGDTISIPIEYDIINYAEIRISFPARSLLILNDTMTYDESGSAAITKKLFGKGTDSIRAIALLGDSLEYTMKVDGELIGCGNLIASNGRMSIPWTCLFQYPISSTFDSRILSIHPNPTSGSFTIDLSIGDGRNVALVAYDPGDMKKYALLQDIDIRPGRYSILLDPSDIPSGVYFLILIDQDVQSTGKLVIIH